MTEKKTFWLARRLAELHKSGRQLAFHLDISPTRLYEIQHGKWSFQTEHIRKAAEFLNFDSLTFLDFLSGQATEEQLWAAKPQIKISDEDMRLLAAVKSLAIRKEEAYTSENTSEQTKIPSKEQER